jgi:(p)ppGpp synthase/HD superfamily hydrolase
MKGFNISEKGKQLLGLLKDKPHIDLKVMARGIEYAATFHRGQMRKSGEPFYHHPIEVASILVPFTIDQDTLIAALLHDTVEDTTLALTQIAFMFNPTIAHLVAGVTKFNETWRRHFLENYEMHYKLLPRQETDRKIIQIKIADRLHNMRTIQFHPSINKQKKIAEETLDVFIPVAQDIGLDALVKELEALSIAILKK